MFAKDPGKRGELYDALLAKIKELGRKPTFAEVKEDQNMPHPNDYAYYFGSFTEAAEEVWKGYNLKKRQSPKKELTIKKLVNPGKPG